MNRRITGLLEGAIFTSLVFLMGSTLSAQDQQKPNIIFIVTDDHGYNDLEATDLRDEVDLPNIHRLSTQGALMTQAYCTAPQCVPSRAGIVSGRYQQKFKLERNGEGPLPSETKSIASRLKTFGYRTGHVGKWHLDPNRKTTGWLKGKGYKKITNATEADLAAYKPQSFGYDEYAEGVSSSYWSNFDVKGKPFKPTTVNYRKYQKGQHKKKYRLQIQTELALNFINRGLDDSDPFFLYLAYYGPHSPLDAPESLTTQVLSVEELEKRGFDNTKKSYANKNYARPYTEAEVRQQGLALLKGIDNGVGKIYELLKEKQALENTIIIFMSDNGAPIGVKAWDGSLNTPWYGSKGIIFEGGSRIPFIVHWPGVVPPQLYSRGVSTLDAGAMAVAAAGGFPEKDPLLDGVDLIPFLKGDVQGDPHQYLYQRYANTASVVSGQYKFMRHQNGEELLFDVSMGKPGAYDPKKDFHEAINLIDVKPERAKELRSALLKWTSALPIPERTDGYHDSLVEFGEKRWNLRKK
ncbi:MAG: sulfatase-like hydrolase/transferase [Verrucomicrobia bacterium]|nr:sulfatase-like hydrolase/transferase [Verrucomicrobiota bacterium]